MSGPTIPARRGQRTAAVSASTSQTPLLSHEALEAESEEQLIARGGAYVVAYNTVKNNETTLLRNIAVVLVELRRRCLDSEGRPDWHGRTYAYRQLAARLYAQAGVPRGQDSPVQSAVRYHVGNHLRDVVPASELAEHSLKAEGPAQRNQEAGKSRRALVAMARHETTAAKTAKASEPVKSKGKGSATGAELPPPAVVGDHIRLGAGAGNVLGQLSTDVIDAMTDGQRARLDGELKAIQETVAKLRRHTRKRTSKD